MGENTPLKDCVIFFFSETKVKCVQKSCHSFSDNDIHFKPSMKNVQSGHVIRFFTKITFVPRGRFTPPMWQNAPMGGVKCPPV